MHETPQIGIAHVETRSTCHKYIEASSYLAASLIDLNLGGENGPSLTTNKSWAGERSKIKRRSSPLYIASFYIPVRSSCFYIFLVSDPWCSSFIRALVGPLGLLKTFAPHHRVPRMLSPAKCIVSLKLEERFLISLSCRTLRGDFYLALFT